MIYNILRVLSPGKGDLIFMQEYTIDRIRNVALLSHGGAGKTSLAEAMLFDDSTFDAIFFFGVLHHIAEKSRVKVLQESVRVSKLSAAICFSEPNQKGMERVKERYPSHPEAADPSEYARGLNLSLQKKKGDFFDSFILKKEAAK